MRSAPQCVREIGADLKLMTSTAEKITHIGFTNSDQDAETANNEIKPADSDQDMEHLLLAASGAIQRLFGEDARCATASRRKRKNSPVFALTSA